MSKQFLKKSATEIRSCFIPSWSSFWIVHLLLDAGGDIVKQVGNPESGPAGDENKNEFQLQISSKLF
jgi:hypothetical protein